MLNSKHVLCTACGMPMEHDSDFAQGDRSKNYCIHCARPDGSMQSYEEKVASMTNFIMRTQQVEEAKAKQQAVSYLTKLPAWAERNKS